MPIRKPTNNYRCLKKKLIKIINNTTYNGRDVFNTINDAVKRTNKIITKTYMLLRLMMIDKYHKNESLPKLTDKIIRIAFNAVINNKGKKQNSGDNKILLDNFKNYYNNDLFSDLEDGTKLSTILSYSAITMITCIENNIRLNFVSYLSRYLKTYFTQKYEKQIANKDFKKQLFSDIQDIKNDIINNTLNSSNKYHEWILNQKPLLIPILKEKESIIPDLHSDPQKYFKYMIFMTGELEKMERKQYQFFPLQTNSIPRHIHIDNKALIELFENNVKEKFQKANSLKELLWLDIFKLNCSIKNYVFDYCIITDGYSASIRFISSNGLEKKKNKIEKMKKGKTITENKLKGLSIEEKKKVKNELKDAKNKKEAEHKNTVKENISKKIKNKNNKKSIDINNDINNDITNDINNKSTITNRKSEFLYIDDVNKNELEGKHIFIDPGKRALFTMVDDDNNYLKYTNSQYMNETKRLKYSKKINKIKNELKINEEEKKLNNFNSKTIDIIKFKNYIKNKLEINKKVIDKYFDERFRKYKYYTFINTKRTEDRLLNKIEEKYSSKHKIIIGDWSIL